MNKIFVFILFFLSSSFLKGQDALQIVKEMMEKSSKASTLTMEMKTAERMNNKFVNAHFKIKRRNSPLGIYYYQINPDKGIEILVNETMKGVALVNPNAFPWVSMELDVNGSLMREFRHQSIYNAGLDYFSVIMAHLITKYADKIKENIKLIGSEKVGNIDCYKISLSNPHYKVGDYICKKNETPLSIAKSRKICEYKILELNSDITNYKQVLPEGKSIKVPNDYAREMKLWINKSTKLPVVMEIYDEKGLFEKYEFINIQLNVSFLGNEFDKNFKDYKF